MVLRWSQRNPIQSKVNASTERGTSSSAWMVIKSVWRETGAAFILHVFNMLVLTALIVTIQPSQVPWAFFCPLAFLSYNVGDLLAKSLIGIDSLDTNQCANSSHLHN